MSNTTPTPVTPDPAKGGRIRAFFELEAEILSQRLYIIETLLPNSSTAGAAHKGEEGRYLESALREFLNRHLPANLRAMSGFIVRPATKTGTDDLQRVQAETDQHSSQLDIIVYDVAHFPIYERFEEFCVVPPEGVVAVISVKKRLYKADVESEMNALKHVASLCHNKKRRAPYLGLFAYTAEESLQSSGAQAIFPLLKSCFDHGPYTAMPTEVSVFDQFVLFKLMRDTENQSAKYVEVSCADRRHIPLQRLLQSILSVHYDPSRGSTHERPGFVSFAKSTFADAPEVGCLTIQE